MKKRTILLAAVLAAALTACGGQPAEESPSPAAGEEPPAPAVSAAPSATPVPVETEPAVDPVESGDPAEPTDEPEETGEPAPHGLGDLPSDEEVLTVYRAAVDAYNWFTGYDDSTLALDPEDALVRPDVTLYRVGRPGLESLDGLRAYLKTLFSDEIVDELMPADQVVDGVMMPGAGGFVETENGLYARPAGRGADITKGGLTLAVLWPEEEAPAGCVVQATVELLDWSPDMTTSTVVGSQTYDFPYQKVGDKWVFTHFESIF